VPSSEASVTFLLDEAGVEPQTIGTNLIRVEIYEPLRFDLLLNLKQKFKFLYFMLPSSLSHISLSVLILSSLEPLLCRAIAD